jgi:hypothetical protein
MFQEAPIQSFIYLAFIRRSTGPPCMLEFIQVKQPHPTFHFACMLRRIDVAGHVTTRT